MSEFSARVALPVTADEVLAWHRRPGAFERLAPPWEKTRIVSRTGGIEPGARVTVETNVGPVPLRWELEHRAPEGGEGFADVQLRGPFASWRHDHLVHASGIDSCVFEDRIRYALPRAAWMSWAEDALVRPRLERLFAFRHRTLTGDLGAHRMVRDAPRRRVLISGSTGLLGGSLACFLSAGGHEVIRLVRAGTRPAEPAFARIEWDPARGFANVDALDGIDTIVHLAGESLASGPWTSSRKRRILESRVLGTRTLAEQIARSRRPPETFICASAVGWYGDRGVDLLDETVAPGRGFLADVCRAWETAAQPAREAGIRVVWMRFGVVVSGKGGAIPTMAIPFRLGAGGPLGDGRPYFSWISLDDAIGAVHHALFDARLAGPVNAVAPRAVTNAELTRTLGHVLGRPTFFRVPAAALRLLLGEMANEMLLASTRATPRRLEESGYTFRHPELEGALRHELGRVRATRPGDAS